MEFSVIIPLYNKAPYIKKALRSIIEQSFRDYELIVVDDGSSDGSFDVTKETLKESGLDYHLIRQDNAGVSTARNNGIAASHGEFICFLDADDWWAEDFLQKMDLLIREYPDAGIYGTNYYYVKNGKQRVCVTTAKTGYINYCKVYAERLQMPLWTGATCIRREVFDEVGGFRTHLKLGEDFDLWIRVTLKHKVAFLDEPLAYYYQDSDPAWRGTGHLTDPRYHMLWNLAYLEGEEKNNADYKNLIDGLRTYGLLPYYLSSKYREDAQRELVKVDWDKQPRKIKRLYRTPVLFLKIQQALLKTGSGVKQWYIRNLSKWL